MRSQYHSSDRDNLAYYFIIFTQRPVEFIVIVLEFVFLKENNAGTVWNVHTHAVWDKEGKREKEVKKEKKE